MTGLLRPRSAEVVAARDRSRRAFAHHLDRAATELAHARAQVRALSPAATLERGYAVVQLEDGAVVRAPDQVAVGATVRLRVAAGSLLARRVDEAAG